MRAPQCGRRASTDDPGGHARSCHLRQRSGKRGADLCDRLILLLNRLAHVAGIEHQSRKLERRLGSHPTGERDDRVHRWHADAAHAKIDLHENAHNAAGIGCGTRDVFHRLLRIERHHQANIRGKRREAFGPRRTHRRKCHQNVVRDPGHDLGLVRRGTRDTHGAECNLSRGDARRLVRLHVRAQRQPVAFRILRGSPEIALHDVEVDDQRRCLERIE